MPESPETRSLNSTRLEAACSINTTQSRHPHHVIISKEQLHRQGVLCFADLMQHVLSAQAWSPYLRQDIDTLKRIQRRATKMIRGLGKLSYEGRLMRCGLTNLEKRRTRGDLIVAHKIMTGKEAISAHKFFKVSMKSRTRGHGYKLYKNELGSGGIDFSVRWL